MRPYVSVNELFCDARAQLKNYYTTFFGMSQATAAGTQAFHQLNPALVDAVYCYACRTFRGLSVCLSQATAAWMLYFVATDAYRSVAYISSDDERAAAIKHKLKRIPRDRCPPSRDQSRSFLGRTLCGAPAFAGWAVVYIIYNVQLWTLPMCIGLEACGLGLGLGLLQIWSCFRLYVTVFVPATL